MYAMEANPNLFQITGDESMFPLSVDIFLRSGEGMRELSMEEIEFVSGAAPFRWGNMGAGEYAVPFAWGAAMGGMSGYAVTGSWTSAGILAFFGGVNAAGGRFLAK